MAGVRDCVIIIHLMVRHRLFQPLENSTRTTIPTISLNLCCVDLELRMCSRRLVLYQYKKLYVNYCLLRFPYRTLMAILKLLRTTLWQ